MSHVFQLSDDQYARLAAYAAQYKQTPESMFQAWVRETLYKGEKVTVSNGERSAKNLKREDDESMNSPLLQIAGMFAVGEPGWADRHDEYLAETYLDDHANK